MKSAWLAKSAMCICPPAVVATTAATVPPVRHAVHRFTAAYEPHHKRSAPSAPCIPTERKTFASLLPSTSGAGPIDLNDDASAFSAIAPGTSNSGGSTGVGPSLLNPNTPQLPLGPGLVPPGTNNTGGNGGDTSGVPEPAVWVTMVLGFGLIGAGFRQQRRYVIRSRKLALAGGGDALGGRPSGLAANFGGALAVGATLVPIGLSPLRAGTRLAELGSKALHSSFLAKAAMCVCPTVGMALGTATVPPVRHAIYKATAPSMPHAPTGRQTVASTPGVPCVPIDVPTASEAVQQGDKLAVLQPTANWPG